MLVISDTVLPTAHHCCGVSSKKLAEMGHANSYRRPASAYAVIDIILIWETLEHYTYLHGPTCKVGHG